MQCNLRAQTLFSSKEFFCSKDVKLLRLLGFSLPFLYLIVGRSSTLAEMERKDPDCRWLGYVSFSALENVSSANIKGEFASVKGM